MLCKVWVTVAKFSLAVRDSLDVVVLPLCREMFLLFYIHVSVVHFKSIGDIK